MSWSTQQGEDVSQAFEKEKAKLDEVMKDAKRNMAAKNDEMSSSAVLSDDQNSAMAVCELRSGVQYISRNYMSYSWIGYFMTTIPEYIASGDGATIVHKGSKGFVTYGSTPDNPRSVAWLLVYVKAGTKEVVVQMFLSKVEKELALCWEDSQDYDPESGAMIVARIRKDSDKVAMVAATLNMI